MTETMDILALISVVAIGILFRFYSGTWWGAVSLLPFCTIIVVWILGYVSDSA